MVPDNKRRGVKTTETVFDIIEYLRRNDGAQVTEVANELEIAKSTAHRHVTTLQNREYVQKDGDIYRLGFRFLHLGVHTRNRRQAYQLVEAKVRELASQTDERAQFIVEEHGLGVFIFRESGENAVETNTEIGKHIPLHTSASGKAILANIPEERVQKIVNERGLPSMTENSITDADVLLDELETIRERGYSINNQENLDGLRAVGVRLKDRDGQILGALSVSGPSHRMKGEWFQEELPNLLLGTANELELNITYL